MAKRAALRGFLRPARSSLISKYKDYLNLVSLKKEKKKLLQVFFLRLKRFYSEQTNAFEPADSIFLSFICHFFKALTQDNDSKLQISSLVYSVVH